MRKIFAILFITLFTLFTGCAKEDAILPKQQENFRAYLKNTHVPRLLSEAEKELSLDVNPPYYTESSNSVYRYIADIYNPERESKTLVAYGDEVTITFRMYLFAFNNITDTMMPYYSNDKELEAAYIEAGLDPALWSFEPLTIKLGETEIIKGLELALEGCREGDLVEAYMTYNMAYGKTPMGIIPKESPIAIFFTINGVKKNSTN